jgi:hypothetical protein
MSFTLDVNTDVGKVRYLIGDITVGSASFTDEELQGFLNFTAQTNLAPSIFLASALACDSMAGNVARTMESIKLGDYENKDIDKYNSLKKQAQGFRDLEYNTPAFAVIEENLSGFNELQIIRNFILRTEA